MSQEPGQEHDRAHWVMRPDADAGAPAAGQRAPGGEHAVPAAPSPHAAVGDQPHAPADAFVPLATLPADVDRAIQRILDTPEAWSAEALNFEEVENRLLQLADAIRVGPHVINPAQSAGERILQQRLLDLLRFDLLGAHASGGSSVPADTLLDVLFRLESIRHALDPEWHQLMPARLAGSDGLSLVVEVVHDIRSPLNSIMLLAETLRRGQSGDINDAQRKQLGIIYSAALGLITVASDVIELARGGDPAIQPKAPFSIRETFDTVRDMVRPLAEEKGLELRFHGPYDDARVGNGVALARVLLNLVTNALKFTERGYIDVRAENRGGARIEFSVRDTGTGMDMHPDALFRPFLRSTGRGGYRFSGTGLGLSICRRTVEALGGELHFESAPDWGTRFHFELDLPKASRY